MMKKKEDALQSNQTASISLTSRQTSLVLAISFLLIGSSFLAGYFWGKRSVVLQFAQKVDQDSFADQIYASLCALYDYEPEEDEKVSNNEAIQPEEVMPMAAMVTAQQETNIATASPQPSVAQSTENSCDDPVESITADQQETISKCYAELVGFGSERSASLFANKLVEKGYSVAVKKRSSVTAQHKKVAWFQVVTQPYQNKDSLQEVVDRIAQEEKLKGIRIVFI